MHLPMQKTFLDQLKQKCTYIWLPASPGEVMLIHFELFGSGFACYGGTNSCQVAKRIIVAGPLEKISMTAADAFYNSMYFFSLSDP